MGRRKRHSAKTGDGGAEIRHRKKQLQAAELAQKEAELEFFDNPSEDESHEEQQEGSEGEGSEFGSEEEVFELGGDDDDEDDDEEVEEEEDDDDLGLEDEEEKARVAKMGGKWGNSKKTFYSADTADYEVESDEEAAKDEEEAAMELQRKQAEMMDAEDFGLEEEEDEEEEEEEEDAEGDQVMDDEEAIGAQLADLSSLVDRGLDAATEHVTKDFSRMSRKEKLQIVNEAAPELLGLVAELKQTMQTLREVVVPAIHKLKDIRRQAKGYEKGMQYLVTRQNLLYNYAANISFYLLLRAEGKSVADHPVLTHLLLVKKQLNQLELVDDELADQLQDLMTKEFVAPEKPVEDGMDKFFGPKKMAMKTSAQASHPETQSGRRQAKKSHRGKDTISAKEKEEALQFYEAALQEKQKLQQAKAEFYSHEKPVYSSDEEGVEDGAKRGATYQIMKNTGLKAHKSKVNRNPRVKKRMQYRKAVIRRKGQVRDVRVGEAAQYGGETTGIKANVVRSRKIRN